MKSPVTIDKSRKTKRERERERVSYFTSLEKEKEQDPHTLKPTKNTQKLKTTVRSTVSHFAIESGKQKLDSGLTQTVCSAH